MIELSRRRSPALPRLQSAAAQDSFLLARVGVGNVAKPVEVKLALSSPPSMRSEASTRHETPRFGAVLECARSSAEVTDATRDQRQAGKRCVPGMESECRFEIGKGSSQRACHGNSVR